MFNITPSEFLIIALLALVVLGPERLPDMARSLGRLINKARDMTADLRDTVDSISDDPAMKPLKDLGELATRPRQKLAEFAAEAEAEERAERIARDRAAAEEAASDDSAATDDSTAVEVVTPEGDTSEDGVTTDGTESDSRTSPTDDPTATGDDDPERSGR